MGSKIDLTNEHIEIKLFFIINFNISQISKILKSSDSNEIEDLSSKKT